MEPSKSHVSKLGLTLISESASEQDMAKALAEVDIWRALHLKPLQSICEQLDSLFKKASIPVEFSSSRIKRMESIIAKLHNNSKGNMRLGGLDNIGGARYVFKDMECFLVAYEALKGFSPKDFSVKKIHNYTFTDDNGSGPKESGYRSIHFIYEYKSDDKVYDGLHVELQIRTVLQHSWAMAVETASMIDRVSLKANINDGNEWREFFRLVSAIFSRNEKTQVLAGYDNGDICERYHDFNKQHKLLEQFRALRTVTEKRPPVSQDGYYLLTLDLDKKIVNISSYANDKKDNATRDFAYIELLVRKNNTVALLVSLSQMTKLRTAYPSYFLDTGHFLDVMKKFYDDCSFLNW